MHLRTFIQLIICSLMNMLDWLTRLTTEPPPQKKKNTKQSRRSSFLVQVVSNKPALFMFPGVFCWWGSCRNQLRVEEAKLLLGESVFWSDCPPECKAVPVGDKWRKRNLGDLKFLSWVHHCSDPDGAALRAHSHLCAYLTREKRPHSMFGQFWEQRDMYKTLFCGTGADIFGFCERRVYLCVQTLTRGSVLFLSFCGCEWIGFWILNKTFFFILISAVLSF